MPSSTISARPKVAVIGCGYWGKNIVRNFAELGALAAVCDEDAGLAEKFAAQFKVPARALPDMLADPAIAAVALATPAARHAEHVAAALRAGKHVFVEKPLALSVAEGRELERLAKQASRTLMVGHLLHYHPAYLALLDLLRAGRLGRVYRVVSNRLSLGKLRTEEDVIWSFAPHDISMILGLIGEPPTEVAVEASAILDPKIFDVADIHLHFPGGASARISVSWLNPYKEHKLTVMGSDAHAVFDDMLPWSEKLSVFDHRVDRASGRPVAVAAKAVPIAVEVSEPLRDECAHFLECLSGGASPRTDAAEALRVLSVLEAASRSARGRIRILLSE